MVKVTIQLGVQKIDNDGIAKKKEQRSPTKKVIVDISQTLDHDKATANTHGRCGSNDNDDVDDGDMKKYSMCSLLIQIGRMLGVVPLHTPFVFDKILEKWCLHRRCRSSRGDGEENTDDYGVSRNNIYQLSDMNDGDTIELCCGDYVKDLSSEKEGYLLALIPSRYNTIVVDSLENTPLDKERAAHVNDKADGTEKGCHDYHANDDDDDDDSDIEDVTDIYVSKKRRASQEVIEVEDTSSDDDYYCKNNNHDESCFWEFDKYGYLKKNANHSAKWENAKSSRKDSKSNDDDDDDDDDVNANIDIEIESIISTSDDSDDDSSDIEDVTETIMAQRKEQVQKLINNAEEICDDSDSNNDDNSQEGGSGGKKRKNENTTTRSSRSSSSSRPTAKKKRRRTTKKKMKESPIEVLIDEKDIPTRPGAKITKDDDDDDDDDDGDSDNNNDDDQVDHSIKQRIVKLLNTGFHGESNEHEARNAMKLARRLIERHNLDQAVLLQERGDGSLNDFSTNNNDKDGSTTTTLVGGFVIAKIRNRKKGTALSSFPRWHDYLVSPVCMNFHVEAFKTLARASAWRTGECSVTFYGIQTNVQLAAYAFKIASERIAHMAATYEPPRNSNLPRAKQIAETRTARLSYALGIVKGLERDVKDGLQKEEERRKANLRKAQEGARAGEAYEEDCTCSDGDDHGGSSFDDVHEHGDSGKVIARDEVDHPEICQDDSSSNPVEHLDKLERENTAHLALVDHHKKIASDVLKSKNIKVRAARKRKSIKFNRKAYEKGVIDSKEVDLNQQAIEEK